MVKFAWFLSILLVVLVLQFSDALQCYSLETKTNVECPSSCVYYICRKDGGEGKALERVTEGIGCLEDFFNEAKCSSAAKDFIKKQTFLDLHYYNGYVDYVSGCRTESDKKKCIYRKMDKLRKETHPTSNNPHEPKEQIVEKWYSTAEEDSTAVVSNPSGGGSKSSDGGSNPDGSGPSGGGSDSSDSVPNRSGDYSDHSDNGSKPTSSSNQNGAFKFIGIIIFGWIFTAAV